VIDLANCSFTLVLAQLFERRQTEPILTSPYAASAASHICRIMATGPVISDVSNCPLLILFANSIPINVTSATTERLEPQHRITSLRRLPMILLNHVIQVLVGPDERLSGQYAFGLQFGDGLMRRLTAVECDLLRDLMTADRFFEEAHGGRNYRVCTRTLWVGVHSALRSILILSAESRASTNSEN
jgi:hypothetical protein